MTARMDRRTLLGAVGAATAISAVHAVGAEPGKTSARTPIDFSNDTESTKAYAKLAGTVEDGTVHYSYQGNIYGVTHDATKVMVGFTGFLKMVWRNLGNGSFHFRNFDLGYFTEPDSVERIDEFENPFTGKKNHPIDIKGGPFDVIIPPQQYPWIRRGDDVWLTEPRHFGFKNKLDPIEWPQASTGEFLNMLYLDGFQGKISDLENDDIKSAPSYLTVNHVNPWYPFFLMGKTEGVNYWHGQGKKVTDLSDVPTSMLEYVEDKSPGFVENDLPWPTRTDSYLDYKTHRQPIKE